MLVCVARAGEPWAQEALFRRHVRRATELAHRLLASSREDVDELVRVGFVQALRSLRDLRATEGFASWLGDLVVRAALGRLRRRRLRRRLGLLPDAPMDLDETIAASAPPEVRAALGELYERLDDFPAEERVVLLLRRLEGFTLEELSGALGASVARAKRRLRRAERRLATAWSPRMDVVQGRIDPKVYLEPELSDARVAQLWARVAEGVPARTVRARFDRRGMLRGRIVVVGGGLLAGAALVVGAALMIGAPGVAPSNPSPPLAAPFGADAASRGELAVGRDGGLTVDLEGGARLWLGPRAQLEIDEVGEGRVALRLVRGRVTWDAPLDVDRGIVLRAGEIEVRGVGTRGSMERALEGELSRVEVEVEGGGVEVVRRDGAVAPHRLGAGERWVIEERIGP